MKSLGVIKCWVFSPNDNVGVLVASDGKQGQTVQIPLPAGKNIKLKTAIPKGHKIAVRDIKINEPIIKFGQIIGASNKKILAGEHVHVHNIRLGNRIGFSEEYLKNNNQANVTKEEKIIPNSFRGYLRIDGRVGIRNYIVVASTVNCSAGVVRGIANYFKKKNILKKGIDGIVPVIHNSGCAQAIGGYAHKILNRTIAGWLTHPNVVGVMLVGLGCEGTTLETVKENFNSVNSFNENFLESLNIQDVGGTKKSIKSGIGKVERILSRLPVFERKEFHVSRLTVALKCGGSDSYSSLTANPALGIAADTLISCGGTVILAEIPELFGAKKILLQRCVKEEREKIEKIFSWWDDYGRKNKVNMNDNLSPGNISGGLSTILEKSLGALAKSGSSGINQVVDYAQRITKRGVVLMNTPGFDPVAVTGMVAGGSHLVAFATGRGSVFGCSIAPTIKIATNSEIYKRLKGDLDIDAGRALNKSSIAEIGREIYDFFIRVASGAKTHSEKNGMGEEEFVPWQVGEVL